MMTVTEQPFESFNLVGIHLIKKIPGDLFLPQNIHRTGGVCRLSPVSLSGKRDNGLLPFHNTGVLNHYTNVVTLSRVKKIFPGLN
jgi:hypothetical protein